MSILNSLVDHHIPATGFVIAGSIGKGQWDLLEEFRKEGFDIGNHTYSHANLNRLSADQYIKEISQADTILAPIMTQPKYFRYPYLAEGHGVVKQEVQDYLAANQYTIAPVTIDSKDYQFNGRLLKIHWRERAQFVNSIKQQYLSYIWKETLRAEKRSKNGNSKQILLVHSNLLNSYCLGDVIDMYQKNGYRFISLSEALTGSAKPISSEPEQARNERGDPSKSYDPKEPATQQTSNEPPLNPTWSDYPWLSQLDM
jgi:peptidoglycan/xylan/chitin deacetylase (PgdA/CDA1 family)